MRCKTPYMYKSSIPFGCGQCIQCRINKKREWTHRIVLESLCHRDNAFVTLTYNEENLPEGGTLVRKDITDFLKRLRDHLSPLQIRYFAAGEYGELNHRPHYHIALFGYPHCTFGLPSKNKECLCEPCRLINRKWNKGFTYNAQISFDSAQYIAGYVTKKMTNKNNEKTKNWLAGRAPEFGAPSLKPGIGAAFMDNLIPFLTTTAGCETIIRTKDVPAVLNHGGKSFPLGRYLRRVLREKLGFKEIGAQEGWEKEVLQKAQTKMLELYASRGIDPEDETVKLFKKIGWITDKELLIQANADYIADLERKEDFYKQYGRTL